MYKKGEFISGLKWVYVLVVISEQSSLSACSEFVLKCIEKVDCNMFYEMKKMADNISSNSDLDEIFKYINVVAWNRWTIGLCFKTMALSANNMD